jgi:hypothetical protein
MPQSAWTILGLAPTPDVAEIRRAYARRLKALRPETDPQAFQRLLAARGVALREAARLQSVAPADPEMAAAPEEPSEAGDAAPGSQDGAAPPIIETIEGGNDAAPPSPPIVIREIDLAPLEADQGHRQAAAQLAAAFHRLLKNPRRPINLEVCRRLLADTARLPRAARDEVEARLVQWLAAGLRVPGRSLDQRRARWIRPVLVEAEPVFDWLRDDAVITSALDTADAAAFSAFARDASLAANPQRRSLRLVRRGAWPGLADADARAFLRGAARRHLATYEAFRAKGRLPWRLDGLAFTMPAAWAARHRSFILFVLAFGASWGAFSLANLAREQNVWFALPSAALYLGLSLAYGLGADRLLLWRARRVARRASRKLIYDRRAREEYLLNRSMLPGLPALTVVYFAGIIVCFLPYTALVMLLDLVIRLWGGSAGPQP